jgi:hypothetical protein
VIHQSDLADEDLAELWDAAISAKFPSTVGRPSYRSGFIDKAEFFALLSELQAKLAIREAIRLLHGVGLTWSVRTLPRARNPDLENNNKHTRYPIIIRNSRFLSANVFYYLEC